MSTATPILNLPASLLLSTECPRQTAARGLGSAELRAALEASQALSREIGLDALIETLLTLALRTSGADFGMLLFQREEGMVTAARAWSRPCGIEVRRSGVRPDAQHRAPLSAIGIPLLQQGEPSALLYLEHAARADVFTPARVAVLELLAPQAAISLAHAHLYQQLRDENSQRKRADEALRRAQCELARVARVTTMGELAASIAHEVNQPLAAIVLNAGAGLNWLRQDPPRLDQVQATLQTILRAGSNAGEVIRSINNMARKSGPELAPFAVDDAIREVLQLLRTELQKHGIEVRTDFTPAQHQLHADRTQLQQVMMNLFLNAIEAMGGVTTRPRLLEVRSAIADASGTLRISVEDSGSGIDASAAEHLFDPLFSTRPEGMGMGLSICRSIAEAHGGRIWSTSRQPHGTTFHISLPAAGQR